MPKPKRSLENAGISDNAYFAIMQRVANDNYKNWGLPNSDAALVHALNDNTYNYRGYYNKYPNGKGNAIDHWTDEFKTVYHPTFSKESKYSGKKSQYNPKGITGGTWYGEYFLPSVDQYVERSKFKFASGGKVKSSFVRSLETQPTILEQVAEYNKEPKVRRATKESYRQQRIREQKAANQRERNIAKHYLAAGPNIANLAKAAYHWYNSVPMLGGQPEDGNTYITGIADVPGMRSPKSIVKGVSAITKSNAAKITPNQWTAAQDAAIARGDMAEAQRLRDLHFKVSAPQNRLVDVEGNPVKMIHGSQAKFTEFKHKDNPFGTHGRGMYFGMAPKDLTTTYGGDNGYKYLTYLNGKSIYPDTGIIMRDNARKVIPNNIMYEIIGTNSYDEFINSVTRRFRDTFEKNNQFYDLKNIEKNIDKKLYQKLHDSFDTKMSGVHNIHKKKHWFRKDEKYATFNPERAGEIVVRDPNQIKSADAVTYDDNGVRIPLGERDNFKINDIRYGLLPFLGLGAAGALYRKQE